ncbi:acyl-protein thioesterase 2-like isoform X2 [Daktulosphaira vitifoliae]|uniref:acyl-protein thioesterase 2-like isoform X2 n=1 Tax=Daktulosphaira vitifoliae TaxID=58002 RepID=UPI0021AA14E8|nr:acyl-protein thioesterase 2-like isoform X2 [Daktulosphaira vitifoliae]
MSCRNLNTMTRIVSQVIFFSTHEVKSNSANYPLWLSQCQYRHQIIFFHGLGESGNNWSNLFTEIRKPHTKIICPSASKIPLDLNKGYAIPAWFNIASLDESSIEDESAILRAVDKVHDLLDDELSKTRIPSKKILIGGFSQGGALALYAALTYHKPLAGILLMSTWIPLHRSFPDAATNNQKTPILQCHGTDDPVIPYRWGQKTSVILNDFVSNIEFITYEGLQHRVNKQVGIGGY